MSVDTQRLTPVDFCIMVLWIYGLTTGQVHDLFARNYGKSKAAVRGVINRIPSRRDAMTREDRQKFLDHMKVARIDDGKLEEQFFRAMPLKGDAVGVYGPPARKAKKQEQDAPSPDTTTRKGRKAAKQLERKRQKEELERQARKEARERGGADRGQAISPLEFLRNKQILEDDNVPKGSFRRDNNQEVRFISGTMLRDVFAAAELSGVKTQQFEVLGSSSNNGFSISLNILHARQSLTHLHEMLKARRKARLFSLLSKVIRDEQFVWVGIPPEKVDRILENIRCGIDCYSVYANRMSPDHFQTRWKFSLDQPDRRSRRETAEMLDEINAALSSAGRKVS